VVIATEERLTTNKQLGEKIQVCWDREGVAIGTMYHRAEQQALRQPVSADEGGDEKAGGPEAHDGVVCQGPGGFEVQ